MDAKAKVIQMEERLPEEVKRKRKLREDILEIFSESVDMDTGKPISQERARQDTAQFLKGMEDLFKMEQPANTFNDERFKWQGRILGAALALLNISKEMRLGERINPAEIERRANAIISHNEILAKIFKKLIKLQGNPVYE